MAEEKEEIMMELTEKSIIKQYRQYDTFFNYRSKPTTAADIPQESANEVDEVGKEQETGSPAVGDLNQEMVAALEKEVQKWKSRCENLKRTLAETEIKLSEAFREISDLRMMDHDAHPMLAPAPEMDHNIELKRRPLKSNLKPNKHSRRLLTIEPKESSNQKTSMKPKPTQVKARYLEQKPPTEKLPPIQTPQEGSQLEEAVKYELTSKQSRELKLFQAGDMQGKGDKGDE
ncbi:hypothetical protein DPMN_169180 [Dreissena polymorpha]|uniref:Uncharacterized protein n=1 Tax=Dreissena polymorpha TaxID=45954 RepID=A0A9D4IWL6_DREPO|nr:hypothetical protein DPMN_169180 [Dreissena polymorpha]